MWAAEGKVSVCVYEVWQQNKKGMRELLYEGRMRGKESEEQGKRFLIGRGG